MSRVIMELYILKNSVRLDMSDWKVPGTVKGSRAHSIYRTKNPHFSSIILLLLC